MVAAGVIGVDDAQLAVVRRLDRLASALAASRPGLIARLTGRAPAPVRGLYVYGDVGRGKTMLMDAFFDAVPVAAKRRVHFNVFMGEVQDRIHAARSGSSGDPIRAVADVIARETRLLCLDELAVTDIADAMIVARLFDALFERGLVPVATSNSPPDELYRNGLNRGLFLPFVDLLKKRVDIVRLEGGTDYRLAKLAGTPVYIVPADEAARAALDGLWKRLTGTAVGAPASLRTRGRAIPVPRSSDGVARFAFADLCRAPLAAHDYLQIARAYHTVLIDGIAVLADGERAVARRLILLVDTFYDYRVKLIASAQAPPEALYTAASGEVAFAFRRTVSRLIEMQSGSYLEAAHGFAGESAADEAREDRGSAILP